MAVKAASRTSSGDPRDPRLGIAWTGSSRPPHAPAHSARRRRQRRRRGRPHRAAQRRHRPEPCALRSIESLSPGICEPGVSEELHRSVTFNNAQGSRSPDSSSPQDDRVRGVGHRRRALGVTPEKRRRPMVSALSFERPAWDTCPCSHHSMSGRVTCGPPVHSPTGSVH